MIRFLATLAVAYLAVLVAFRLFEDRFIYFPNYPGRLRGDWRPERLAVEDVWLRTADGVRLHAWWVEGEGADFTFLAFHGKAANIANRAEIYRFLRDLPANVLAVEYRGYGRSEGTPSEAGLYRDAEAAYHYLVGERGIAPKRIVVFGGSLGTAVAVNLAARHQVAGVVLEAPFPSAKAVARRVYPFLPGLGYLVRSKFDTLPSSLAFTCLGSRASRYTSWPKANGSTGSRAVNDHETSCAWYSAGATDEHGG